MHDKYDWSRFCFDWFPLVLILSPCLGAGILMVSYAVAQAICAGCLR